ncbi:MAG: CHAT domain-containing protein, partial [Anaerolineales bacterium]
DDSLAELLARLKAAGGGPAWHIVVDWGTEDFRAIRLDALAELVAQAGRDAPAGLGGYDLPRVRAIDRNSMNSGQAQDLARQQPDGLLVVTAAGKPVGVVYEGQTLGANDSRALDDLERRVRSMGVVRIAHAEPPDAGPPAADAIHFTAQPALDAPAQVAPEGVFTVTVGFRADLDPALSEVKGIDVTASLGETFTVTLLTDGARVIRGQQQQQPLALDLAAKVTFECQAQPGVSEIRLTVHYVLHSQLVGMATRRVAVGADAPMARRRADPCRLGSATPESQTDLQVTITRSRARPGYLQWTFVAPNPAINIGPVLTELGDAREFAALIIRELKTQQYEGLFAGQILANKGQDIADAMPLEFFETLAKVFAAVQRAPTLLLLTDETYVPWELALLETPLDPARPPYLGAQVHMGRWLLHEKVAFPPPANISVTHLTAVAASYGLGTDLARLQHALDEQQMLATGRQARPLQANRAALQVLVTEPKTAGHLIHFAVHGLSDPDANDQALLLDDKTRLLPSALAGRFRCGETPAFSFVFLNACQVGTAASCLGQAAGFPGDLIRGGTLGFLAPLWDVDDEVARAFAERFYAATLDEHQTVGEILAA